ncbi:hypothetical protein QYF36_013843 [Acer negundo]|nr:hypothetical protein QYF36_013843 [Acer negundo]
MGDRAYKSLDHRGSERGYSLQPDLEEAVKRKYDKRERANENVNYCASGQVGKMGQSVSFSKKEKGKDKMQFLRKPYVRPSVQRNNKVMGLLGTKLTGHEMDLLFICAGSKAAQLWIDIGPKEASSEECVDGTVSGSVGTDGGTWVEETNFSNSGIGSPVAKGGLGSGVGSQIEKNIGEEEKCSNEEGQNGSAKGGTVIPKKRRKNASSLRTYGMMNRNVKRNHNADENIILN